jgi:endonuclease VIII
MPEGDTIYRAAAMLRTAIDGAAVTGFEAPRARGTAAPPAPGDLVERVEARGKHLLMRFAGGTTLHTHMRMTGMWRTFPADRSWGAGGRVVAVVRTERAVGVCFAAPIVELLDDPAVRRHPVLRALGPDLCLPEPDVFEIVRRSEELDQAVEVGVALLDQRVAAGIGNVYKSEVAFACRVNPFTPLAALDRDQRVGLWRTASELLRRNLGPAPRRTTPHGLAVYDRAGRPCRVCGTAIAVRRQGEAARATWWCPACQPPTPAARHRSIRTKTVG